MPGFHKSWVATAIFLGVLLPPLVVSVQSNDEGRLPGKDWPSVGGDWTGQRYSPLKQITTQNVKGLGGVWTKKFDDGASTRATPVVKDGTMFMVAGAVVYALNAKTGETVWTWRSDPHNPANLAQTQGLVEALNSRSAYPGPPGVAIGEGLVFVGLTDGRMAALRQKTGELVWTTQIGEDPPAKGQSVSGAPVYARGIVFTGVANGDWALRGRAVALDAKTGKELWHFFSIPGPGEFGHDTWPSASDPKWKDIWKQGGGGIWQVPCVDVDLGIAYFVTGNAVPMYGGEARKGDNLFTASVLALDMKTGKLKWHYQVVHHDLWDADIATPSILYDATIGGRTRKVIGALRADGYLFLLDRESGKPVLPIEERKVTQDAFNNTAATQPYPAGDPVVPPCEEWKDKVKPPFVLDCPGFAPPFLSPTKQNVLSSGISVRVTPMSYSPDTGYIYAQGTGALSRDRRISDDPWFRGTAGGGGNVPPSVGVIAAIDGRTNKIVWKKDVPPATLGNSGPLTTAGGLMFRGTGDGKFEAYDAKTGVSLWTFNTGPSGGRGPASSFEIDGEQYVALATGPTLWTFKLGGTVPAQQAPAPSGRGAGAGAAAGAGGRGAGRGGGGQETDEIETATMVQTADRGVGHRYAIDEHAFNPSRAQVKVGTRVTFINNGRIDHTVGAEDGSWTTGLLKSGESGYATFTKPGTYTFICKEHPWATGQLTVVP